MAEAAEVVERIRLNPFKNLEDIKRAENDLTLLRYLLTPKPISVIETPRRITALTCKICGPKPLPFTMYHYQKEWYCAEHLPKDMTWPIGMHGDDLKTYKDQK